ncbi:MAG: hypothetical protein ACLGI8_12960 [Acidimicrobiia bacterium]|jgi:hypothetical protein
MGKASSAKKVARAARAGGRVSSGQSRSLLFPGVIALVVVLGVVLVVYAREDRRSDDLGGVPQLGDHIHQAVGVYACGEFLPDMPEFDSNVGIHTHADGVIHIHPFSQLGVGANATLGRYIDDAREDGGFEIDLSDTKLTYLGDTYEEGETDCEGVDDPELRVAYWADVQTSDDPPEVRTGDFKSLRLTEDGAGITIYFGDPDADIPKPPKSGELAELGALDGGQVPDEEGVTTTEADGDATTTTAAEDADPADETTTTAAG